MPITITLTKTGIDSNTDAASSANLLLLANSIETVFNNFANGLQASDQHLFTSAQTLQIENGIIDSPTQKLVIVSAETFNTDNLDVIGVSNNRGIVLKAAAGQIITIRSGMGNITTLDGSNLVLYDDVGVEAWCIGSQWSIVGPGSAGVEVTNNYLALSDPAPTDDAGDGWDIGSLWINGFNNAAYINTLNSTSVAKWPQITPTKGFDIRGAGPNIMGIGVPDPTVLNALTSGNDNLNSYANMVSTASAGQLAGFITTTFNLVRPSFDPIIEFIVKTGSDLTNLRYWIGLVDAAITNVDTLAAGREFIGWRLSSVAGDTLWKPVLHDGTTQNTHGGLGPTVTVSTSYKLRFRIASGAGGVYFSIDDGAETYMTTNFPPAATDLGIVCRLIPTTAVIRGLGFSQVKVRYN